MIENVRTISNTFNTEKITYIVGSLPRKGSLYEKYLHNYKNRLDNALNNLQKKSHENIFTQQMISDKIIEVIEGNPNNFLQAEYSLKLIANSIQQALLYLEEFNIEENKDIFLSKLKSEVIKGDLRRCLLFYGLVDKEFKKMIEKYYLLGEIGTLLNIVRPSKNFDEDIDFREFYDENAFKLN